MSDRIEFLGVQFDSWTNAEIARWLAARDAGSAFGYLVTPNVDHVVRLAQADDAVRRAYAEADICVCDSRILQRLALLCGVRLAIAPGSDLVAGMFATMLQPGDRVCVIGCTAESVATLRERYPALEILHHAPPMGLRDNPAARAAVIAFARDAAARVILLGVGAPQQELLAHEMACSGDVRGTALCTGAAIEFLIGAKRRAPGFLQTAGLEWLWRLMTEPRRLAKRYLVDDPAIFPMALRWWWARRSSRG